MSEEAFGKRRHALEESFFEKKNRELLENLKNEVQSGERKAALSQASGITNETVLEHLVSLEIGPEAVAALSMVPLLAVAWADGRMEKQEREAVLKAANVQGLCRIEAVANLLEHWLTQQPDASLLEGWKEYVAALCQHLDNPARESLKKEVLGQARKVAESAGGFLGIGSVSSEEKAVLKELEQAFGA
jgi:tellurite resistance protein